MSKSLSQSAANTIRPTNVRASVGSRISGSSASPKRKVCAPARVAMTIIPAVNSTRIVHDDLLMLSSFGLRSGRFAGDSSASSQRRNSRESRRPFGVSERPLQALEPRIRSDRRARQHRGGRRDLAPEMTRYRMSAVRDERRGLPPPTPPPRRAARSGGGTRKGGGGGGD